VARGKALGWGLVGVAAAAMLGFATLAGLAAFSGGAAAGAEARAAAARLDGLADAATDALDSLRLAEADNRPPDAARLAATAGRLRAGVAGALAAEAQAGRLGLAEIEELARLATSGEALAAAAGGLATGAEPGPLPTLLAEHAETLSAVARALRVAAERAGEGYGSPLVPAAAALSAALAAGLALRAVRAAPAAALARPAGSDDSRARFVAMMNHELRTPMNGVIGLISVLKEGAVAPDQARMLDEAERAGRQMAAMIEDLLEQEAGGPTVAEPPPPFRVEALADALRELFAPAAARSGVDFSVECRGELPPRATGDGRKLLRALSHLCGYVLEKAGTRDVRLALSHDGAECRAELSFDFAKGHGPALDLAALVETGAKPGDELTGSGLGPLLAKGLLERMGGRLEVTTTDSGRVLVLAATPSLATTAVVPRVRIMAQTRSLGALGAAAASAAGVEVLAAEDAPVPDIVLVEAGGPEERPTVDLARSSWPKAAVIALGDPAAPALFDAVVRPPLEPARVAEAVDACWARRADPLGGPAPAAPAVAAPAAAEVPVPPAAGGFVPIAMGSAFDAAVS
jgi:signal transduction histidine kinase